MTYFNHLFRSWAMGYQHTGYRSGGRERWNGVGQFPVTVVKRLVGGTKRRLCFALVTFADRVLY